MARPVPPPVFTLRSLEGEVTALAFIKLPSHSDEELLTGHSSGKLQLWNLKTNRSLITWSGHENQRVKWVGAHFNQIFSYGADGRLCFWEIAATFSSVRTGFIIVECCTHCPCDIATRMPALLAVPQDMDAIKIIAINSREIINSIKPKPNQGKLGMLMYLRFAELSMKLSVITGYESGAIILWDVDVCEPLSELVPHSDPLICMDFHLSTMRGISGSTDNKLAVWQITDDWQLVLKQNITITNPGVSCVRVHPRGTYVACAGWDCRLRIYSWKKYKPLAVLDFHSQLIHCLGYSRVTHMLAAGSKDERTSFWNLYNS